MFPHVLLLHCSVDMPQEVQQEIIDIMMTAMDKFTSTKNNEVQTT